MSYKYPYLVCCLACSLSFPAINFKHQRGIHANLLSKIHERITVYLEDKCLTFYISITEKREYKILIYRLSLKKHYIIIVDLNDLFHNYEVRKCHVKSTFPKNVCIHLYYAYQYLQHQRGIYAHQPMNKMRKITITSVYVLQRFITARLINVFNVYKL